MRITLIDAGKRFNREWIFRHLHYEFKEGHHYAITGPNGSGKSTLLQAVAGAIGISEGQVSFLAGPAVAGVSKTAVAGGAGESKLAGAARSVADPMPVGVATAVAAEQVYQFISIAAPYLEVIEEMTAAEFLQFHQSFKPFLSGWTIPAILSKVGLGKAADKQIRFYSSGMRQRIRLAQAIFSDTPVILLDEPCTNLDTEGIALYRQLIAHHAGGRMVIVSSNDKQEYDFCEEIINIMDFKP